MALATIFGLSEGRSVYPIDWGTDTHPAVREVRESLSEVPFCQEKARELESNDAVLREFETKHPDPYADKLGYAFWNSAEYNEATAEAYRLSMQVYGDSCCNLYYVTRGEKMLGLIDTALGGHRGERVIVLTGAGHKHYFDRALARRNDVRVVSFSSLLPLGDPPLAPAVAAFLDEGDDQPYYDARALASMDMDGYYSGRLRWRLLHAPDMDLVPEKVPGARLLPADKIVERWSKVAPESPRLLFNRAWLAFLRGEFEHALDLYAQLCDAVDAHKVDDDVWVRVPERLGFARVHDVMRGHPGRDPRGRGDPGRCSRPRRPGGAPVAEEGWLPVRCHGSGGVGLRPVSGRASCEASARFVARRWSSSKSRMRAATSVYSPTRTRPGPYSGALRN
jgi:hypothetical protein